MSNKLNLGNVVTPKGASAIFGAEATNDFLNIQTENSETYNPYNIVFTEEQDVIIEPDWAENNTESINYIQNRTHWKEEGYKIIVPEQTISGTNGYNLTGLLGGYSVTPSQTWKITLHGVEYVCQGAVNSNSMADCYMGNLALRQMNATATPEYPFCIYSSYDSISYPVTTIYFDGIITEFTLKIEDMATSTTVYHPLEEGYIPDAIARNYYAVCSTAASTSTKTINNLTGFKLFTGAHLFVKFTNGNNASNPTLNVNGTGAKPIRSYGTTSITSGSNGFENGYPSNALLMLVYDGEAWLVDYAGRPAVGKFTSLPSSGSALRSNAEYRVSTVVNTYNFTLPSDTQYEIWVRFTTGTSPAITFPAGTQFLNAVPEFEANTTYELTIKDGVVGCTKIVTA